MQSLNSQKSRSVTMERVTARCPRECEFTVQFFALKCRLISARSANVSPCWALSLGSLLQAIALLSPQYLDATNDSERGGRVPAHRAF